jgi:hypothetical protein
MALSQQLSEQSDELMAAVKVLNGQLTELVETDMEKLLADLNSFQRAKLYTTIAFSLVTMIYLLIRLNGLSPKSHPVRNDITNIKVCECKLRNTLNDLIKFLALIDGPRIRELIRARRNGSFLLALKVCPTDCRT